MRFIIVLLSIVAVVSCNNSGDATDGSADKNSTSDTAKLKPGDQQEYADVSGCYIEILQRDTFTIKLEQTKNAVTGNLTFDNYEKDGSTGAVHGTIEGNIIKLWYNFESEGMNSVMEVYFRKEGESLLRGIGPVNVKGDTSYFIDHSAIQYVRDQAFNKLSCEELPGK